MSFTRLAVARPVTTIMASLIVVILGWVALTRLPVDLMPNLTYPTVSVVTLYPGAGPAEIETLITRPLEQTLSSVSGVQRLASTSAEGSSTIRVRLQWGTNVDSAVNQMRQAIAKIRRFLPIGIEEPYISQYDVADWPIMYLGLTSDLNTVELTHLAEKHIAPRLERLDGVARVGLRGDARREIQVDVDRQKLEARGIPVNEVVEALRRESVSQPAGDFEEGHLNLLIRSQGEFSSLTEIADTVVREHEGAVVRVRDLARVVDGEERRYELTRTDGRPGIMIYIFKQAGANTVQVSNNVRDAVERLNAQLEDASLAVRIDRADFIRQSIGNVRDSALYGMGLAIVVLVVFLRSFRSTLVIAISMPLSVLATFVLVYFMGFTLNMVSFGGLALGIGLLVDNSIVVLESIYRKREEGLDAVQAAITGTGEVAAAIIASTLTTLIVFLPLLFIDGITGILLHQLAWVVSMSLVSSLFASLTLTPVLTVIFDNQTLLAPAATAARGDRAETNPQKSAAGLVAHLHRLNRRLFQLGERAYGSLLAAVFRRSGLVSFSVAATFAVFVGLIPLVGTEFMPVTDEGDLRIDSRMEAGIQLKQLDRQSRLVEQVVLHDVPEVDTAAVFVGDEEEDGDAWNTCRFRIKLLPRSQRERSIDEIRKDVADRIGPVAGMDIRVQASSDLMMVRMLSSRGSGGATSPVEVDISGFDPQVAQAVAEQVAKEMRQVPGLVNVMVERQQQRPELAAHIDRAKASLLGIRVSDVAQTLETTVRGTRATVFRDDGDEFDVLVRLQERDRNAQADVEHVGVSTPTGRLVPLNNLVSFDHSESAMTIDRLDQQRFIAVTADVEDRDLGSTVTDLQQRLDALTLPTGFMLQIAGDWEEQQQSFTALRQGFILALFLMYMVMASQFESLRSPLLILVTIPLGAIGVIAVLVGTGTTLNVQSFIGVVMLAGIVVNNAIVMVDYMQQLEQAHPHESRDALIARAAVRRFRPILMTTLTTVLAMMPIALGWGEGGELQAPMARVVIGGLTSGTLITLVAIPLVYRAFSLSPAVRRPAAE